MRLFFLHHVQDLSSTLPVPQSRSGVGTCHMDRRPALALCQDPSCLFFSRRVSDFPPRGSKNVCPLCPAAILLRCFCPHRKLRSREAKATQRPAPSCQSSQGPPEKADSWGQVTSGGPGPLGWPEGVWSTSVRITAQVCQRGCWLQVKVKKPGTPERKLAPATFQPRNLEQATSSLRISVFSPAEWN